MPELAEVEYFRKQWSPGLGQRILRATLNPWARIYRSASTEQIAGGLVGSRLCASETHGKQMLFRTEDETWLGIHLGMTGALSYHQTHDFDERYAHLVLQLENEAYLVFSDPRQFGHVVS